ncbi:ATP-binding protein, partial [Streptomyces puniciscabiei]|uniref:ATP-binding protein n=1 Tax=Streptomyces puniciscabiei TaxID=164348 RepID=UPI000AEDEC95
MSRVWDIPVQDSTRVRDVRVAAEAACARTGLDADSTAGAALVATELATNLVKHASGGRIVINLTGPCDTRAEGVPGVQITSLDHGPGIGNVQAALQDGHTTASSSLGAGLMRATATVPRPGLLCRSKSLETRRQVPRPAPRE